MGFQFWLCRTLGICGGMVWSSSIAFYECNCENGIDRYDDTNPEAERKEYIDHIEEIVKWMGWEPFKVLNFFINIIKICDLIVSSI